MKATRQSSWVERARRVLPGGVNSPVRAFHHIGTDPLFLTKAKGAYCVDSEGKEYIDFCQSFGPHLYGHSPDFVCAALQQQLENGTSFGACHPLEVTFAERLLSLFPFAGKARLLNSGTEAVMTAVRLARGYTGRTKILKVDGCYHGHSDGLLTKAGSGVAFLAEASSQGIPPEIVAQTLSVPYSVDAVRKAFAQFPREIAAFLVEPIPANHGLWVPPPQMLEEIVGIARDHGALVLFDEVITGLRIAAGGACERLQLHPDLVTLGKVVGGGLPLAAVVGRSEILRLLAPEGPVYQAGTFSGNILAVAAGLAVLEKLQENPPYAELEIRTQSWCDAVRSLLKPLGANVFQLGSIFWITWAQGDLFPADLSGAARENYSGWFRSCLRQGIYLPPSPYEVGFCSMAHTPEVLEQSLERFARAARDA